MKKNLLLSVLGLAAMSAFALDDITPANYKFNDVKEFNYAPLAYGTSNFAAPVWNTINGDQIFNNGAAVICGAVVGWGPSASVGKALEETPDGPSILAGTSLVDLGGEVGQVLCISGMNSKVNDRIKELYDLDLNIPNCTGPLHWFNINFFTDPATTPTDGGPDYFNVRCRITCNFYYNFPDGPADGTSFVNPFLVGNQNNIQTTDNQICADWFIKTNEDGEPIDDEGEVNEDQYFWDPEKWIQFEVNTHVQPTEEDKSYTPARLKYDIKVDPLQAGTMFIKSIEFFAVSPEEAINNSQPVIKTIALKADPANAGIQAIAADKAAQVSLNGRIASFSQNATVYNMMGSKVAAVAANQGVSLQPGVYVANVNGKSVKFFVK